MYVILSILRVRCSVETGEPLKYGPASLAHTVTNEIDILYHSRWKFRFEAQGSLSKLYILHNISVINLLHLQTPLVWCQTKSDKL